MSCHTGSLLVWVVSAGVTHGAGADDASVLQTVQLDLGEVDVQFHVVQVVLDDVLSVVACLVLVFFFCCFINFVDGFAA